MANKRLGLTASIIIDKFALGSGFIDLVKTVPSILFMLPR